MSSIPLPALGIKSEDTSPLQQVGQALSVRNMLQQGRENDLKIQQEQLAMKDQQAATAAMHDWDGKDMNALPTLMLKHGASSTAVIGMKKNIVDQQQKLSQIAKDDAETGKNNLANMSSKNDMLLGSLQAVTQGPDEGLGQRLMAATQDAVQKGLLDPQHAQGIAQLAQLPPAQLKPQLSLMEKSFMSQSEQFKQANETAKTEIEKQNAAAKTLEAQNSSARLQAQLPGGALRSVEEQQLDAFKKNTGGDAMAFAKWKSTLAPQAQISIQGGAVGPDLAKAVANGQMKISDVLTARTPLPLRKQFLGQVMQLNPDFKSYDYDVEKGVVKNMTSGTGAQNLTNFNTAIEHAKQLDKAIDALGNGSFTPLNQVGNMYNLKMGKDNVTNFNVIKNALAGEISKVFKGGQATDAEIHAVQAPFDAANSPSQLKGALKQAINLMNSKRDALRQQYQSGIKAQPNFGDQPQAAPAQAGGFDWGKMPQHK